jgi:hypothetical protein
MRRGSRLVLPEGGVLRPSRPWLSWWQLRPRGCLRRMFPSRPVRHGSTTDAKHHSPKRGKYASPLVFKPSAGQFGSVWGSGSSKMSGPIPEVIEVRCTIR